MVRILEPGCEVGTSRLAQYAKQFIGTENQRSKPDKSAAVYRSICECNICVPYACLCRIDLRSYLYGAAARGEDEGANPLSGYGVGSWVAMLQCQVSYKFKNVQNLSCKQIHICRYLLEVNRLTYGKLQQEVSQKRQTRDVKREMCVRDCSESREMLGFFNSFALWNGRKVGSVQWRVRRSVAAVSSNCTPLWREARMEVTIVKKT